MKSSRRRSFLSGASVLTLSALAVKVIGMLYRIPLLGYLGTEGMGYFNAAYEVYALFCVIATAGLPVAMSVLISARDAGEQERGASAHAERVFRASLVAFLTIGLVGTALLWGLSAPFAALLGSGGAVLCMRAISPTVFLICLSAALRGYFQGHRDMIPTAVSQVVEAAGKLVLGLVLAMWARSRGCDLPTTAAWAVLGVSLGTALSLCYLALTKRCRYPRGRLALRDTTPIRTVLRNLASTALPITAGAGIMALAKCLDLLLIHRRLADLGLSGVEIASLYGCYSTLAIPLFNMLPALSTSIALPAVPALASAFGRGKEGEAEVRRTATSAWRVTLAVSLPASLGLAVFSGDILALLFSGQPTAVAEATPWLSCLALSVPAACLVTVTGGMLQAAGRASRPTVAMLIGVAVKMAAAYVLIGKIGMMGAPVSSLVCDGVIVAVNLLSLGRYAPAMLPTRKDALQAVLTPAILSALSVGAVMLLRNHFPIGIPSSLRTLLTVGTVACLYGAGLLLAYLPKIKTADILPRHIERRMTHETPDQDRA